MDAVTARDNADLLSKQASDTEAFIAMGTRFVNETVTGDLTAPFIDGAFKGKTWGMVYKEVEQSKRKLYDLRREVKNADFKAICLESVAATGKCYISVGGTDCDCSSFGYATAFDSLEQAETYRDESYESADGPMYIGAITKEDFDEMQSYSHDLALVASENGNPYSISEADWNRSR